MKHQFVYVSFIDAAHGKNSKDRCERQHMTNIVMNSCPKSLKEEITLNCNKNDDGTVVWFVIKIYFNIIESIKINDNVKLIIRHIVKEQCVELLKV